MLIDRSQFETCILSPMQQCLQRLQSCEHLSVEQMIRAEEDVLLSVSRSLSIGEHHLPANTSLMSLIGILYQRHSDFGDTVAPLLRLEAQLWEQALRNDQLAGTVRPDVDVCLLSRMFINIRNTFDLSSADSSDLSRQFRYLYSLIL